ncbi:armadillo-type protein, partial [Thamnocephalis sphaerospora]
MARSNAGKRKRKRSCAYGPALPAADRAADLYFMFGDEEEEQALPTSTAYRSRNGRQDDGDDEEEERVPSVKFGSLDEWTEEGSLEESVAGGSSHVLPDKTVDEAAEDVAADAGATNGTAEYASDGVWNNGSLRDRLQAWYEGDDDDEDDDDDDDVASGGSSGPSAAADLLHRRRRGFHDANYADTHDENDDGEPALASRTVDDEEPTVLEHIYTMSRSEVAAQRAGIIRQLGELLYSVPPADAVDYCVDLLYTLTDDAEDSVRWALAEELDKILTYFFNRCLPSAGPDAETMQKQGGDASEGLDAVRSPAPAQGSATATEDAQPASADGATPVSDQLPTPTADGESTREDTGNNNNNSNTSPLQPGAMVELLHKLILDPSTLVAEAARDALIRLFIDKRVPEAILRREIMYDTILALDGMDDGSSSGHMSGIGSGGFSFGMGGGFGNLVGGGGGPALGQPLCAALNILTSLVAHLDNWTCEREVLPRLVQWARHQSFPVRRDTVTVICALAARLPERRSELLVLYSALSTDAIWHVRQACARCLDRLMPLIFAGENTNVGMDGAEPQTTDDSPLKTPTRMDMSLDALEDSAGSCEPLISGADGSSSAGATTGLPSASVLDAPGNEHVRALLSQPALNVRTLQRRTAWVLDRYDTFLGDTSRGVREAAWEAIGRICAAFPRGQVPDILVARFVAMSQPQDGISDIADQERITQCAYNMPAMVLMLGPERWSELRDCYSALVGDPQLSTRRTLAHSLPVLASMLHPSDTDRDLVAAFQHFMQDVGEVRSAAIEGLADLFHYIPAESRSRALPSIITWFRAASNDWRTRENIMTQLVKLGDVFTIDDVVASLPLVEDALMDSVAQVREAATSVLAMMIIRTVRDQVPLARLTEALDRMSRSHMYRIRSIYLKVCEALMQHSLMMASVIRDPLLERAARLALDPVANIRLTVVRLFHSIAPLLSSDPKLGSYAAAVVEQLQRDNDFDVRQAALALVPLCSHVSPSALSEGGSSSSLTGNPSLSPSLCRDNSAMSFEMEHTAETYGNDMETVDLDIAAMTLIIICCERHRLPLARMHFQDECKRALAFLPPLMPGVERVLDLDGMDEQSPELRHDQSQDGDATVLHQQQPVSTASEAEEACKVDDAHGDVGLSDEKLDALESDTHFDAVQLDASDGTEKAQLEAASTDAKDAAMSSVAAKEDDTTAVLISEAITDMMERHVASVNAGSVQLVPEPDQAMDEMEGHGHGKDAATGAWTTISSSEAADDTDEDEDVCTVQYVEKKDNDVKDIPPIVENLLRVERRNSLSALQPAMVSPSSTMTLTPHDRRCGCGANDECTHTVPGLVLSSSIETTAVTEAVVTTLGKRVSAPDDADQQDDILLTSGDGAVDARVCTPRLH